MANYQTEQFDMYVTRAEAVIINQVLNKTEILAEEPAIATLTFTVYGEAGKEYPVGSKLIVSVAREVESTSTS